MYRRFTIITIGLIAFIALTTITAPPSTLAYQTGPKWQDIGFINYYIDPANDGRLHVAGSAAAINMAAGRWSQITPFSLFPAGPYDATKNTISTADLSIADPCGGPAKSDFNAVTCIYASPTTIVRTTTWFNISPTKKWNTSGTLNCGPASAELDVLTVITHEFGHWYHLADNPPGHNEAIMHFDCTHKVNPIPEDDGQGITEIYGPRTGFEFGFPTGQRSQVSYSKDVAGYFNTTSPPPELGPVAAELGVPVSSGTQYLRMAGYGRSAYSYAYFTLFSHEQDSAYPISQNYLRIRAGMKLKWLQYNYQQSTMSLDLEMTDGTTLRDSGLTDQNGITVHPAGRGALPIGQWFFFQVDLSPLAGKTIRKYMVAYDNGNNGKTGQFRGYFDDIQISY